MKPTSAALIYFSPTGATKRYAQEIVKSLGLTDVNEIDFTLPKDRSRDYGVIDSQIVIVAFPVYEDHPPELFTAALRKLRFENQPAIAFSVYGKVGFGLSLRRIFSLLAEMGLRVMAMGAFIGEHSFSSPAIPLAPGRPDGNDLEDARQLASLFQSRIDSSASSLEPDAIPATLPWMAWVLPKNSARKFTMQPAVNEGLCTRCGVCVARCPVSAIGWDLQIDNGLCIRCFACVKACKAGARRIEYQKAALVKRMFGMNERADKANTIV